MKHGANIAKSKTHLILGLHLLDVLVLQSVVNMASFLIDVWPG